MLRYVKGYIFDGHTFVVNKSDIHNAKDEQFVEGTALMPDGWISVKDRLPDEEQDVLMLVEEIEVYGKHDERKHKWHNIFVGYCDDGNWLTSYCYGCEYIAKINEDFEARHDKSRVKVTHWMPLPGTPKGDNE